jgi:hypothetical protein
MPIVRYRLLLALALSLGVHVGLLALGKFQPTSPPAALEEPLQIDLTLTPEQPVSTAHPALPAPPSIEKQTPVRVPDAPSPIMAEEAPVTMAAPPAPTAEEWQLASTYTLKNSKRYRHNWGQQLRSMMGTAIAGERQGLVRFQIEIAPDGKLARADVLWSTSDLVEKIALEAIRAMPPLPPTPTGKPLIFEKTIALLPFETGWPPIYKYDCLPGPQAFKNPFSWNGSSPQRVPEPRNVAPDHGDVPTECPDAPADSIEAEEKDMERQFKEWGAADLHPAKDQ